MHSPSSGLRTSVRSRFGIRFVLLARRWRRVLDTHLAHAGLTDATWAPLIHLSETGGGMAQKDLALLVGVDDSSLVRVLDILERQELIERRRSKADGRARLVYLTPGGKKRVTAIRREVRTSERKLLTGLTDAQITATLHAFAVIDQRITALESAMPTAIGNE